MGKKKKVGFNDEFGVPDKRFYHFLDESQSARILAEGLREAYEELFAVNTKANEMSVEDVKNKLRTLTMGQKSDNVLGLMANTFKSLSDLAEWDTTPVPAAPVEPTDEEKMTAIRSEDESVLLQITSAHSAS